MSQDNVKTIISQALMPLANSRPFYCRLETEEHKRAVCVGIALELIREHISSGSEKAHLEYEMSKLSSYADVIQDAIEGKSKSEPLNRQDLL